MSNKLTKPHDHFFRSSMSDIRVSKGFLNQNLPEKIKNLIDIDSIEPQKESYINNTLKEHLTDLLYSAKFEGQDGYIYCIVEHQSKPDPMMPFRLLEYTVSVMSDHIKKTSDRKLPIV